MPFVFPLQTLFRVRELREQAELQILQTIAAQVAGLRAEIERLDKAVDEQRRDLCRDSLVGLSGADLHLHMQHEAISRDRRQFLATKLREMENAREVQQAEFVRARQERETLSTVREQQLAGYEREQARHSQRILDDLFLIRYVREKNARKVS